MRGIYRVAELRSHAAVDTAKRIAILSLFDEAEATRCEQRDERHLTKREMIRNAGAPAGAKRIIGRARRERGTAPQKAFRHEPMRFRKVVRIVVEEPRTDPDAGIARKLEEVEFECRLHLTIEHGS